MSAVDDHLAHHRELSGRSDAWSPEARKAASEARKGAALAEINGREATARRAALREKGENAEERRLSMEAKSRRAGPQHSEASRGSAETWHGPALGPKAQ